MRTASSQWDQYLQRRTRGFGWTMIVMGLSFFLYYLGLFGNEPGPLSPENIAGFLSGLGVDRSVFLFFCFSVFFIAVSWNHCINLVIRLTGKRKPENFIRKGMIAHSIWIGAMILWLIVLWQAS